MKSLEQLQTELDSAKRPLHKLSLLAQIDQVTQQQAKVDRKEKIVEQLKNAK
jgi:hypothetical protein